MTWEKKMIMKDIELYTRFSCIFSERSCEISCFIFFVRNSYYCSFIDI